MGKIIFAVVLVAALVLLGVTNPGEDDFRAWVEHRVEERLSSETGDGGLGRILTEMGSSVVSGIASRAAVRGDFLFFSVYTIDLGADGEDGEKWRFVGIAGQFFEVSTPESMR